MQYIALIFQKGVPLYQRLPSTVTKRVYKITMPNNAIGNFWWFVSDILVRDKDKTLHKQLISNGHKCQWENQTKILLIAIKSTPSFFSDDLYLMLARIVSDQFNRDDEKQALFEERSLIIFLSTPQIKD